MNFLQRWLVLMILWLPFSIGGLVAILTSFIAVVTDKYKYAKNCLRAMDKVLAAVLGFSGYHTLSAELGVAKESHWVFLRKLVNLIQAGHCEGAAKNEGLMP